MFSENISNIVIDLQKNGGGNSSVMFPFLNYLGAENCSLGRWDTRYGWYLKKGKEVIWNSKKLTQTFEGQVYVLMNTNTFSAAESFAEVLRDNDLAILVGETSGNKPDCFIDIVTFQMPHSKFFLDISYKKNYRIDQNKSGQPLTPDYITDQPMEKVYELIAQEN